jgi:hypothetical protein
LNFKSFEIIEWLDHCTYSESRWRTEEEVTDLEPIRVLTLGFVIGETKNAVKVVSTGAENGHLSGDFLILKKAIVRRKKIKTPWKDWSK